MLGRLEADARNTTQDRHRRDQTHTTNNGFQQTHM